MRNITFNDLVQYFGFLIESFITVHLNPLLSQLLFLIVYIFYYYGQIVASHFENMQKLSWNNSGQKQKELDLTNKNVIFDFKLIFIEAFTICEVH